LLKVSGECIRPRRGRNHASGLGQAGVVEHQRGAADDRAAVNWSNSSRKRSITLA
jgi:hypothetical protein